MNLTFSSNGWMEMPSEGQSHCTFQGFFTKYTKTAGAAWTLIQYFFGCFG
jgi:hypothetical protein